VQTKIWDTNICISIPEFNVMEGLIGQKKILPYVIRVKLSFPLSLKNYVDAN
jgi:hypothetical protein